MSTFREIVKQKRNDIIDWKKVNEERIQIVGCPDLAQKLFDLEESYSEKVLDLIEKYQVGGRHGLNVIRTTYVLVPEFLIGTLLVYDHLKSLTFLKHFVNRFTFLFLLWSSKRTYCETVINKILAIHQVAEYDMIAYDWSFPNIYCNALVSFFYTLFTFAGLTSYKSIHLISIILIDLIHHFLHFVNHTIFYPYIGKFNVSPYIKSYIVLHWLSVAYLGTNFSFTDLENNMLGVMTTSYDIMISSIENLIIGMKNQCCCKWPKNEAEMKAWLDKM